MRGSFRIRNLRLRGSFRIEIGKTLCSRSLDDFRQTSVGAPLNFGALVAFRARDGLSLCELATGTLQPELKSSKGVSYVSMGSGQMISDPFLGLQRRIFWKDGEPPSLSDGVFATVWTLQHAVDVNAGGIKEPIEVAVLENIKGNAVARQLDSDDCRSISTMSEILRNTSANTRRKETKRPWKYPKSKDRTSRPVTLLFPAGVCGFPGDLGAPLWRYFLHTNFGRCQPTLAAESHGSRILVGYLAVLGLVDYVLENAES